MNTSWFLFAELLPLKKLQVILIGALSAIGLSLLAPVTAASQTSAQRDQEALTILGKTIAAGEGQEMLASVQDITETGTITYNYATEVTGTVIVKSRGLHQLRIDADLPEGKRSTVVSGGGGSLKEADGRNWPIYRQSANDLGSLTLPYLPLIAAMQDSTISIVYGGLVTHNDASVYDIRLQKIYTRQQDPSGNRGASEVRDFYIEPETFRIATISDEIHYKGPSGEGVPHEILYSNYKSQNGISLPLRVEVTIRGMTECTITLNQVTYNSGLGNTDFAW